MPFRLISSAHQIPLMARDRILISLDAATAISINAAKSAASRETAAVPAKWKVCSRNDLYKVHEVEPSLRSTLPGPIKRIAGIVCHRSCARAGLTAKLIGNFVGKFWPKPKGMNMV